MRSYSTLSIESKDEIFKNYNKIDKLETCFDLWNHSRVQINIKH